MPEKNLNQLLILFLDRWILLGLGISITNQKITVRVNANYLLSFWNFLSNGIGGPRPSAGKLMVIVLPPNKRLVNSIDLISIYVKAIVAQLAAHV